MIRVITYLVLALIFSVSSANAQQGPTFTVTPTDSTVDPGDNFSVDVTTTNFDNLVSFQFSMGWDPNILQLDSVTNLSGMLPGFTSNRLNTGVPGQLAAQWDDSNFAPTDVPDGSVIFTLNFTALNSGTTTINFTSVPTAQELLADPNEDGDIVEVTLVPEPGTVTVTGDGGGGDGGGGDGGGGDGEVSTDPVQISVGSASGANGTQVCVPVRVTDFTDITKFQFSMNYNSSIISYDNVQNFGIPNLSSAQFNTPSAGNLVLNYTNTNGATVANGTIAFEVCFDIIGNADASSNVTFSGSPTVIDVQRTNTNIALNSTPGTITVTSSGGGGDGGGDGGGGTGGGDGNGDNPLSVILGTVNGEPGEEVCVPMSVRDFVDIVSFQFSINYNANIMTFSGATNVTLDGLSGNIREGSSGNISISWNEDNAEGISLDNNAVIAELCFQLNSEGTSTLAISGAPTPIEVVDEAGSNTGENIGLTPTNGRITSGSGGGGGGGGGGTGGGDNCCAISGFAIIANDVDVTPGSNFCVDITANDFENILTMQFSMEWNPSIIQYTGVQNFGLPDLVEESFNPANTSNGRLPVSWSQNNTEPVTITNSSCEDRPVLFQVCFSAIGAENTSSNFTFSGNPTSVEVVDGDGNEVADEARLQECAGIINLVGEAVPNITFSIGSANAEVGQDICVPVTVSDFDEITSMMYDLSFDETILQFTSVNVTNNVLPNFGSGQFNTSNASNGRISLNWSSNTGATLPDNTVLYELCFRAIGAGTTSISFPTNPEPRVQNNNGQTLPFVGNPGSVNIQNGEPITPVKADIVYFPQTGDMRCIPVRASNFNDLIAFQFSMMWDPSLFRYESINITGNLEDLNMSRFGTNATDQGRIGLSWEHTTNIQEGVTLGDETILFEVCFTALGPDGAKSPFNFTDTPTGREAVNEAGQAVAFNAGNGCLIVGQPQGDILTIDATVTDATCNGANDGGISINVGGCTSNTQFNWSPNVSTTNTANNLAPGNYTVVIQCGDLSETRTYTVNESAAVMVGADVTATTCFGSADGTITLLPNGGTAPYTYMWSNGLSGGATQEGLSAGTYFATVTDANGCNSATGGINVGGVNSALEIQIVSITNVMCGGDASGAINIEVTGGSGINAEGVRWSDGVSMANRTELTPGNYTVSVTDNNNCTATETVTIAVDNPEITLSNIQVTSIDEMTSGSISVDVSGGTESFTYAWTGPNGYTANTKDISNLTDAGEYSLTVTDTNSGCTKTINVTVNGPLTVSGEVSNLCFGQQNGSIILTVAGGAGNYTYNWDNGTSEQDLTNVPAGTYTVTVTDEAGIMVTRAFTITQSTQINVNANIQPTLTNQSTGSITLDVSGGTPDYTYNWENNISTTNQATGLSAGTYAVTVTDMNGCEQVLTNIVVESTDSTQPPTFDPVTGIQTTSVSCNGGTDGGVKLTVTGGVPDFIFNFEPNANGQPLFSGNGMIMLSDLAGGTYEVTVTDGNGQILTDSFTIPEPEPIIIDEMNSQIFSPTTNTPPCNGGINLEVLGGMAPYTYNWSNGATSEDIGGICVGEYIVTVTDSKGCVMTLAPIAVEVFEVTDFDPNNPNSPDNTSLINPSCPDATNGAINIVVNGGTSGLTYAWTESNSSTVISTTQNLTGVGPGVYTVVVTDVNNRTAIRTFTLDAFSDLTATTSVITNYNGFGASCADANDATIQAVASSSAQGNLSYAWSSNLGNTMTITGAPAGTHVVTVTDGAGCTTTQEVIVTAPTAIEVIFDVVPISCNGDNDGEIEAIVSGGIGGYTYAWDNGNSTPTNLNLGGGVYITTVTDANGCRIEALQELEEPQILLLEGSSEPLTVAANGTLQGSATVSVSGGTAPYTYTWNVPEEKDATILVGEAGKYTVVVQDANGCSANIEIVVDDGIDCLTGRPVITPDGDGLNENFIINCIFNFEDNTLEIYNRWGQLVFEGDNYDNSWRGTNVRGDLLPEGGYFWVLSYRESGVLQQKKGSLTILRE